MSKKLNKEIIAWAFYDWANSAFAVVMLTAFFPLFFKDYLSAGVEATTSTFRLGLANSVASIIIVLLAPVLGAIADAGSARKKFLLSFAALGIIMTTALFWVEAGGWLLGLVLFVVAVIGFMGANVFYDSLIVTVAPKDSLDFISAFGYALGYLGGGLLLVVDVWMYLQPAAFGLSGPVEATRLSFISVAVWWTLFSIPLILFVKERQPQVKVSRVEAITNGMRQLGQTFHQIRQLRVVFLFLIAYWFYIDGVDTIVRMAVDYGLSLGFDTGNLISAILITQFVGFPAAIGFGYIGEHLGTKKGILIAIFVYVAVTLWAFWMDSVAEFYGLAITIGLVQGGVQSLSRSFYARIIPPSKSAEFFGFYNMLGKFAAVLGPLLMGVIAVWTQDSRLAILSIIILFIIGGVLLYFVDEEKGRQMAQALEQNEHQ